MHLWHESTRTNAQGGKGNQQWGRVTKGRVGWSVLIVNLTKPERHLGGGALDIHVVLPWISHLRQREASPTVSGTFPWAAVLNCVKGREWDEHQIAFIPLQFLFVDEMGSSASSPCCLNFSHYDGLSVWMVKQNELFKFIFVHGIFF